MKIMFVFVSLGCGGLQSVIMEMSKGFRENGHRICFVTLDGESPDFHAVPEGVRRIRIAPEPKPRFFADSLRGLSRRIKAIRRAIAAEKPDAIISFSDATNVMTVLAARRLGVPVVVTEHADPNFRPIGRFWEMMRRLTYSRSDKLVSVSAGVDRFFSWIKPEKRAVIYNPLKTPEENPAPVSAPFLKNGRRRVVSVGRLVDQKGFDLLLPAFAKIARKISEVDLIILGEGEKRPQLEKLVEALDLSGRVFLPGIFRDPFAILKEADVFVLSSRYEGFGNALVEAMACGAPAISFDCPSGPGEIIEHGVNGILVENGNVEALASWMETLLRDGEKRSRIAANGMKSIERFRPERIMPQWERLLGELAAKPRRRRKKWTRS